VKLEGSIDSSALLPELGALAVANEGTPRRGLQPDYPDESELAENTMTRKNKIIYVTGSEDNNS
jgi:hypothetical protein